KFTNLLGCCYRKGNLVFSEDGNTLFSPVGNRVTKFDLKNNKSETLPCECNYNIEHLDVSPNGSMMVLIDEGMYPTKYSFSRSVIHTHDFRTKIHCVSFSPDGRKFAVTMYNSVVLYKTPGSSPEINPFVVEKRFAVMHGTTTCIDWSSDSRVVAIGSRDMSCYVIGCQMFKNLSVKSVGGLKDVVVGCFFDKDSLDLMTMSELGELCLYKSDTELNELLPGSRREHEKEYENDDIGGKDDEDDDDDSSEDDNGGAKTTTTVKSFTNNNNDDSNIIKSSIIRLRSCDYHKSTKILVSAFDNGVFYIHEMPAFQLIHSLNISEQAIASTKFDKSGQWIALGCPNLGQLLVWEWQNENYILKQQGHFGTTNCLDYSPDGKYIVSGGEDGKVKLWDTGNYNCVVTFTQHTSSITGLQFKSNGQAFVSGSLDGTVRAFDLMRYRNFRTFTAPERTSTQFSSLSLDETGEVVAAGAQDTFEIFLWSMKAGSLINVLSGHEGPVCCLSFSNFDNILASGSWDHTVRIWEVFSRKGSRDVIQLTCDALSLSFRPDGQEVAVTTLDGQISFWDMKTTNQVHSIEGRFDMGYSRKESDKITAKKSSFGKAFRTICYTADGRYVLVGGQSKYICIYSVEGEMLVRRYEITCNLSLDGTLEFLDKRKMTEWGSLSLVEELDEDGNSKKKITLPGVRSGQFSTRSYKPEVRVNCIRFCPTGLTWVAASSEGILMYSVNTGNDDSFNPFDLDIKVTPQEVKRLLRKSKYLEALTIALRLNYKDLIREVIETVPLTSEGHFTEGHLSDLHVDLLIKFLASQLERSVHIEFYITWSCVLLKVQTFRLKQRNNMAVRASLRSLEKSLSRMMKVVDLLVLLDFFF
ncbi:hypothetical protein HELRODRAFT_91552, partial [Helobdella robusta]|uniref:Ig-like domain-containing protein n=1 Tax=Helobdella robusta TaxID=6412 RepID=T1G853_HELRO